MKALDIDAASHHTLRFNCKSCAHVLDNSSISTKTAKPQLKRQRRMETTIVEVHLVELFRDLDKASEETDEHYGLFVWPSALLLSHFVAHEAEWLCRDRVVLELGCGTGLSSILATLCGATKVYLTDRPDADDIRCNAEANISLNGIESRAEFLPLTWGDMHVSKALYSIFQTVQVILAADCFYQSQGLTLSCACDCSSDLSMQCVKLLQILLYLPTTQSLNHSIAPLLSRWGLTAQLIDTRNLEYVNKDIDTVHVFDSIYLYQVNCA